MGLLPGREEISSALKFANIFAGLDDRQIAKLALHTVPRRVDPEEMLFVEGDDCQGLYIVFSGAIKVFKQSAQGREQVLTVERAGSVVAELPVFDGGPYPASCKAVEPSVLLFISKDNFRRSCREDPELALKVLASVGARLRRLVIIIEELSFLTVRSRLASLLLDIARTGGGVPITADAKSMQRAGESSRKTREALRVPLTMTQQEMAARIGTVRELVSRNLSRLQAEGIIRLDRHTLVVGDLERLEQEAATQE